MQKKWVTLGDPRNPTPESGLPCVPPSLHRGLQGGLCRRSEAHRTRSWVTAADPAPPEAEGTQGRVASRISEQTRGARVPSEPLPAGSIQTLRPHRFLIAVSVCPRVGGPVSSSTVLSPRSSPSYNGGPDQPRPLLAATRNLQKTVEN